MKSLSELTKEELQEIINKSSSLTNVLTKLGNGNVSSKSMYSLMNKILEFGLDINFEKNVSGKRVQKPLEQYLQIGTTISSTIKKRLIDCGLIENKCACCGIGPEWNGKPLTLQLDHINGNHYDNRLDNLRLLCPNCHSQTETYSRCEHHKPKEQKETKVKYVPTKEDLEKCSSITDMAKTYHMGKKSIRNLLKEYGIYECTYKTYDYHIIAKTYEENEHLTIKDIVNKFGCDRNVVEKALKKFNIEKRSPYKKIYQYNKNGNLLNEFNSCADAVSWLIENCVTNNSKSGNKIAECCKGNRKISYGYIWSYIKM